MDILTQIGQNINNAIYAITKPAIRTPRMPQQPQQPPRIVTMALPQTRKMALDESDYSNSASAAAKRIALEQQGRQEAANVMNQRKAIAANLKHDATIKSQSVADYYTREQQQQQNNFNGYPTGRIKFNV